MWEHPSTKQNLNKLKSYGYKIIGPEIGDMACGEFGEGKMTEPKDIFQIIEAYFSALNKNKKLKALVTAGPTNEYIDPVRFITNKSSGKQGYALAKVLAKRGFQTTLISGPTNLQIDSNINLIKVETADEMFRATQENLPADVAIFSAAVADFKIKERKNEKMNKKEYLNLELEKNIDILNYVSKHNSLRPKLVIGFAAETNDLQKNAQKKLIEKNCDWIIANDVSDNSIGFDSDFNEVSIFYKDKEIKNEKLAMKKKSEISEEIIDRVIEQLN
jgi:phosphopantothenoylcysteine decarboxylase/phosphopantothenate--cysteine ligase